MRFEVEAINRLLLPELKNADSELRVCWVMASHSENTDTLKYRFHTHNFYEVHFVLSGHLSYELDGKSITVGSEAYTVIPPKTVHKVLRHSDDFIKVTVAFEASGRLADSLCRMGCEHNKMSAEMENELLSLSDKVSDPKPYVGELGLTMLEKLVLLVAEKSGSSNPKPAKRATDSRVIMARRLIEDNPSIFFTATELADYCNVSLKQLGRLFKEYEGVGVLEYIHRRKTENARAMLSLGDGSIESVSRELGFSDVSYFDKFFRRNVGISPSEYRRRSKKL